MAASRRPRLLASIRQRRLRQWCQRAPRRLPRAGRPYVADLASFWRSSHCGASRHPPGAGGHPRFGRRFVFM